MSKAHFIEFLIDNDALKFGEFKLKSGRISPYFFNLGVFNTGTSLHTLGQYFANALIDAGFAYNVLFGPAYKGIPLVCSTAISLSQDHNLTIPYCFNRKVKKEYGDGGDLVGAELTGNVVMFDDVITAGTTVRETIQLMDDYNATLSGIVIAFDRQERGTGTLSAVQEVEETYHIPVKSILCLDDILEYLIHKPQFSAQHDAIIDYQRIWGITKK